ncbi:MFS transporter [Streptomyces griseoluteus]|uniref:MFS transporter n=1 Tax=Streptomyces griseoluteus TaxID=29306 RepID=UPI00381C8BDC
MRHTAEADSRRHKAAPLFALALGTFAIGSGEFGTNGIIQLYAEEFGVGISSATFAVTSYALGVVIGSPVITVMAARFNRKNLLMSLVALFVVGNVLSAIVPSMGLLTAARFITGTAQGAYFGAGAVVAAYVYGTGKGGKAFATVMSGLTVATIFGSPVGTFVGQQFGWRWLYVVVAGIGLIAGIAIYAWVPTTSDLDGGSVTRELSALKRPLVWVMVAVAALGISSIFAVYTFIGPFITDAADESPSIIPIGLAVFGLGMAVGNLVGGRLADRHALLGLFLGYILVLGFLLIVALGGRSIPLLLVGFFGVGGSAMMAIPTIQVLLTHFAPDAPTLMGAMNLAALNLANALGAVGGSVALSSGFGVLSPAWAGVILTACGLAVFALAIPKRL